ncbi:IS3 family transposase [Nocardia sp. NPDC059177]|uniref:IS3 family transposase n=1 Tax=Nocardia sp. NPDC059177 TaxID=3346759 RepID=UPI0036754BD6
MAQKKSRQFSPEFRETAAREVVEKSRPIEDVARDCGVTGQTIRNWVKEFRAAHAADSELSISERARLKELERRVRELEEENRFLGKIGGLLREEAPVTVKYAFIASEEGNHSVVSMCRWAKVSRSGFYAWRNREPSATAQRREILAAEIRFCFEHSDGTYGYRRIHAQLARWGTHADPDTVRTIMRELDLVPCQPRPFRPVTTLAGDAAQLPDLVRRDFTAQAPARKLVGDITYIQTWEGWLYLATVLDCYSKKVVGYAMADHMRTELVADALRMAARNLDFMPGETIFHSDRGAQYLSAEFASVTAEFGVLRSVGRTGTCYDNAWAESFNGTLKNERVNRTQYPTREHARKDVTSYIELRYNQIRIHSGIDYRTPNEVESDWFERNRAA